MDKTKKPFSADSVPHGEKSTLEEILLKINRKEEDARSRIKSAETESDAMIERARMAAKDAEREDELRKETIFKEEIKKFAAEARQQAMEYIEQLRPKNEEKTTTPSRAAIPALEEELSGEKFFSLRWLK